MARRVKATALWTNEGVAMRINTASTGVMVVTLDTKKLLRQPTNTGNAGFSLEYNEVRKLLRAGNEWIKKFDERSKSAIPG